MAIFVIIGVILASAIVLVVVLRNIGGAREEIECLTDADCVRATCCHPDSCVAREAAPDCSGIACTKNCEAGTLDCGQGVCSCVNNKCAAVFG